MISVVTSFPFIVMNPFLPLPAPALITTRVPIITPLGFRKVHVAGVTSAVQAGLERKLLVLVVMSNKRPDKRE